MNHYEVLGVNKNSSIKKINKAYKSLLKVLSSDILINDSVVNDAKDRVEEAYRVLSDEISRAEYDSTVQTYYEALGLKENASEKKIKTTYHSLVKKYSATKNTLLAQAMMNKINNAYGILTHVELRLKHDSIPHNKEESDIDFDVKVLLKNIQNYVYNVEAKIGEKGTVVMPAYCTCCMEPADFSKRIEKSFTGPYQTSTLMIEVPYCYNCIKHLSHVSYNRILLLIPPVMAGLCFGFLYHAMTGWLAFSISVILSLTIFFALSTLIKLKKTSLAHTCHDKPAKIVYFSSDRIVFQFTNWHFAELFASANDSVVTEARTRRLKHYKRYITGIDKFWELPLICLVLTGIAVFITGLLIGF